MPKYKQQVQEMLEAHKDIFGQFKKLHDAYILSPDALQKQYNEEGEKVLHIIKRWENNLCLKSESGKYGKYSANLAEKFWTEVRAVFPKIDYIGMQYGTRYS